jgi:hypothetical protein
MAFSLLLFQPAGGALALKNAGSTESLPMCTRSSWASSDKCKDLAVATKNAPKELKKEIERLASLTATSYQELLKEHSTNNAKYQTEYSKWLIAKSKHEREQDAIQAACFKSLGLTYKPRSVAQYWPEKCLRLYELGPSQPYRWTGGPMRDKWAQAWLDLTTLAKTFPQYIQPSQLSRLLNAFDASKACVADKTCLPASLSGK